MTEQVLAVLSRYGEQGATASEVADALGIPVWEAVYNIKALISRGDARYVPSETWEIHVAVVAQQTPAE